MNTLGSVKVKDLIDMLKMLDPEMLIHVPYPHDAYGPEPVKCICIQWENNSFNSKVAVIKGEVE